MLRRKQFLLSIFTPLVIINTLFAKPDLAVTDIWSDGITIHCQLINTGDKKVYSGHEAALYIDGNKTSTTAVTASIAAGERLNISFAHIWQCGSSEDTVLVIADYQDVISEENEFNNSRSETWKCDNEAPDIISGPFVTNITYKSAKISWYTDEDSNSLVLFDKNAKVYNHQKGNNNLDKEHEIILDDLEPSTVYHYKVFSTDDSNNTALSEQKYFETLALSDSKEPQIHSFCKINKEFPMEFNADATDDIEMQKVEFYMDGKLIETDFSWPFGFCIDPVLMQLDINDINQNVQIMARAYDMSGKTKDDFMLFDIGLPDFPAEVDFRSPRDGYDIMLEAGQTHVPAGTMVDVWVQASDPPWQERETRWGTFVQGTDVNRIEVYFDDSNTADFVAYNCQELSGSYDAGGLELGEHDVIAKVYSNGPDAIAITIRHTLIVATYEPRKVEIRAREVVNDDNCMKVTLKLQNFGDENALLESIEDKVTGFVVLPQETPDYNVAAEYDWLSKTSTVTIDFKEGKVMPPMAYYTDTYDIEYTVIPVMYNGFENYTMGSEMIHLLFQYPVGGGIYEANKMLRREGLSLRNKVNDSLAESDYLIVTNPKILWSMNPAGDCDQLFGTMAKLATIRNGVFGFFEGHATVSTRFDRTDDLAIGETLTDSRHKGKEIIMLENETDRILFYDAFGYVGEIEHSNLHENDGLAVGNTSELFVGYGAFADGQEILVFDGYNGNLGRVTIYQYWPVFNQVEIETYFDSCYENGDAIATADTGWTIYPDDDLDEIIIAHDDDHSIYIYDDGYYGWENIVTIPSSYETGDGFTVGNICGNHKDEIIVADIDADLIYIYDGEGDEHSFSYTLEEGDRICTANVYGDSSEEIIIFMPSRDKIEKLSCTLSGTGVLSHRLVGWFDYYLHSKDSFICGDILTCEKDEIIVARGHKANERNVGDMELITSYGGLGPSQEREVLDELISEDGQWARKMKTGWASGDYLLIVGETQIIPSYNRKYDLYYVEHAKEHYVRITDNYYGDSNGDGPYWPDLAMGRIIGNTALQLEKPLLWSIGLAEGFYTLDNPFAICASGSDSEDDSRFRNLRNNIYHRLLDEGYSVMRIHDPNAHELLDDMTNRTVLFLTGHGNTDRWNGITSSDVNSIFDPDWSRPLVYGCTCLSGRYADGYGFAESFLENGASIYVGSTEITYTTWSKWLATRFLDRFIDLGRTAGVSFVQAQRNIIGAGDYWWDRGHNGYISAVMHLYGDPKLQHSIAAATFTPEVKSQSISTDISGPVSSLQITIPDYDVNNFEGIDHVIIPNGSLVLVPEKLEVPSYTVNIDFPAGYRIQNVTLAERKDLTETSGLNLPIVIAQIDGQVKSVGQNHIPSDQFWPDSDFDWTVIEEPNGLTTLRITIYPFYYKEATTEIEFYQTYGFDIDYTSSQISIAQFKTDKVTYSLDETVNADLYLRLPEQQGIDLLAEAAVKKADGEFVAGMEICKMNSVTNIASCSFEFDSTGFDGGNYILEAEIKYTNGQTVAKENCEFSIGQSQGKVSELSVSPQCFSAGSNVDISATFKNTGQTNITGTWAIEIKDMSGSVVEQFSSDINDLAANDVNTFNITWQNCQLSRGQCQIVATVYYDGKTSVDTFPEVITSADFNEDGEIDFKDFAVLASFWQSNSQQVDIAPAGGDCIINYYDLQIMLEQWLMTP